MYVYPAVKSYVTMYVYSVMYSTYSTVIVLYMYVIIIMAIVLHNVFVDHCSALLLQQYFTTFTFYRMAKELPIKSVTDSGKVSEESSVIATQVQDAKSSKSCSMPHSPGGEENVETPSAVGEHSSSLSRADSKKAGEEESTASKKGKAPSCPPSCDKDCGSLFKDKTHGIVGVQSVFSIEPEEG